MNDNKRSEMSVVGGLNAFSRQLMRAHVGLFHSSINDLLRSAKHASICQPFHMLQTSAGRFGVVVQQESRASLDLHNKQPSSFLEKDIKDINKVSTVTAAINDQLMSGKAGRLFAIVHVAGKQRKVTVEDIIILDKPISEEVGVRIRLNKVLLVGGQDFTIVGRPVLSAQQVRVEATILEKTLSHTKIMFWYHKRKDHRVFRLLKDSLTVLRINDIAVTGINCS